MTSERCPSEPKLGAYLGERETVHRKYGGSLPDQYLFTMLLNMLPADVAAEVRDRRQRLNTKDRTWADVGYELARFSNSYISKLHEKQDAESLAHPPECCERRR